MVAAFDFFFLVNSDELLEADIRLLTSSSSLAYDVRSWKKKE